MYPFKLGLDLQGGTQIVLEAETPNGKADPDAIQGVIAVIRNRIDSLGVTEPLIQQKGINQIVVELPGVKDPEQALRIIGDTAKLEFVEAIPSPSDTLTPEQLKILGGDSAKLGILETYKEDGTTISHKTPMILKETLLTGADLKQATPGTDEYGRPLVQIEFTPEGSEKFAKVTESHVGKPLAILLDGQIISAPTINEPIRGGKAQISGNFSITEMRELIIKLKAGALPVPVKIVSNKTVGPTLGRDSIEKSKVSGLIGIGIIFIFMAAIYRIPGLLANITLIIYGFGVLAILKLLHATLTLPGIAGFLLSIGMAVDATIIIFERIKEERRNGYDIQKAIDLGFTRAFRAILDSNVTTLIAAGALFWLGSGSIKGFGLTLGIGIGVSMFTAIFVTRLFLAYLLKSSRNPDQLFAPK